MDRYHSRWDTGDTTTGIGEHPSRQDQKRVPVLTIAAFGTPILRRGDVPLVFIRRKTVALLLYLAVTRRAHSRDALADLLWSELPQERAQANLRKSLCELREQVGTAVRSYHHTVALNPDYPMVLDVAAFEAAVTRGSVAGDVLLLAQAVARYSEDFLAGFNMPEAERFDEWLCLYREHLREQLIAALESLTTLYVERGEYRAALGPARRVVALDPWREGGQRQLMRVLAAMGDRAAAVAQYERCRRTLAEELGVAPSAETVALYEQLCAGTGAAGADVTGDQCTGDDDPRESAAISTDPVESLGSGGQSASPLLSHSIQIYCLPDDNARITSIPANRSAIEPFGRCAPAPARLCWVQAGPWAAEAADRRRRTVASTPGAAGPMALPSEGGICQTQ
jgi:DNA-binding SARP family transcriptional activator